MSRIVGIDYGTKRVGLAVSDDRKILALPFKCIEAGKNLNITASNILEALKAYPSIERFVLGHPLRLNGQESPMGACTQKLLLLLQEMQQAPVILWDERLSSAQAERLLGHMKRKKRTQHVDTLAASIILQSYLDSPWKGEVANNLNFGY